MNSKGNNQATKEEATPALVPRLRFPEFRVAEGWKPSILGDNCDMKAGKFVAASNISDCAQAGLFPCYGGNGLRGYTRTFTHDGTYPLIGRQGALCGNVRLVTGQFHATEHAVVATPKKTIDARWLHYSLDLLNLNQFATGQAQPGLSVDVLENVALAIPPLEAEQQEIAFCLSSVDDLIAAQAQKVNALKTHKKGLMQQLFPREGETQPRIRFPEFQNAGDWEPKTLIDACSMQAGKFVPAADIKEQNVGEFFPCFGGNGLRGFTATHTHVGVYPLIGRQGALCGNIKLATGRFHATEHAVVATPNQGIQVIWLYYLLDLLNLNRFATGQAQPGLSVDVLDKVPVTIPNDEREQHRIASCLSSLDALITAEAQKLETLKTHKKGLMQQLFPSLEAATP